MKDTNKAKLELGDDPDRTGTYSMTFQVVNFSDTQKTYTLDTTVLGQVAQGGQIKQNQVTYLVSSHARELDEMAGKIAEAGMPEAAEQIRKGVAEFQKGNLYLSLALSMVKEDK